MSKATSVVKISGKDRKALEANPDFVYVGRAFAGFPASFWGNPFKVGSHSRESAVDRYARRLDGLIQADPSVLDRLRAELRGKVLGCWCVDWDGTGEPERVCHAVVLARLADAIPYIQSSSP